MANTSTATIKIDVNANTHDIDKTRRKLAALAAQQSTLSKKALADASKSNNAYAKVLGDRVNYFKEHFDTIDKLTQKAGQALKAGIGMASKATALEIAAMGGAMLAVHAAFGTGNFLMKAYRGGLQLLAVGAAAAGAAISSVAAAMREQAAAMSAFRYGPTELGKGIDTATAALRGLQSDADLAFLGVKNLNAAFQAVSQHSKFDAGSQKMLKSLMDFGAASGNIEGSVKQAGELVGLLQQLKNPKTGMAVSFQEIKNAAGALSPQLLTAMRTLGITSKKAFVEALNSGKLAKAGGVEGQLGVVGGTLINQLKGYKTQLMNMFADLGQPFLIPLKNGMEKVFNLISRSLRTLSGAIGGFGLDKFINGLVNLADKLSTSITRLLLNYLPKADGMFSRIGNWFGRVKEFFKSAADKLRPLVDGAKVLEHAFGAAFKPIKEAITSRFGGFNDFLKANAARVKEFGDKIGKLIAALLGVVHEFGVIYQNLLPFITKLVSGATSVANSFRDVLHSLTKIGSFFGGGEGGSLFALLGLSGVAKGMMKNRGGYLNMTKSAGLNLLSPLNPMNIGTGQGGGPSVHGVWGSTLAGLQSAGSTLQAAGASLQSAATGLKSSGHTTGQYNQQTGMFYPGPKNPNLIAAQQQLKRGGWASLDLNQQRAIINDAKQRGFAKPVPVGGQKGNRYLARQQWMRQYQVHKMKFYDDISNDPALAHLTDQEKVSRARTMAVQAMQMGPASRPSLSSRFQGLKQRGASALSTRVGNLRTTATTAAMNPMGFIGSQSQAFGGWFKNQFSQMTPQELASIQMMKQRQPSWLNRKMSGLRNARERASVSSFSKGINSQMGTMGVSIGLGLLSQHVGKKSQGALALGSMIAGSNPLAGLAVAGIGGAMGAQTTGGGGLLGAGGGAALGMMVAGPAGAAVGAALGAISGAIMGWRNGNEARKNAAKQTVTEEMQSMVYGSVRAGALAIANNKNAYGTGNGFANAVTGTLGQMGSQSKKLGDFIKGFMGGRGSMDYKQVINEIYKNQNQLGISMSPEQRNANLKAAKTSVEKYLKDSNNQYVVAGKLSNAYTQKLKDLTSWTGKSSDEINTLAQSMNINLVDATQSSVDALKALGLAQVKTADQFNAALTQSFSNAFKPFETTKNRAEANNSLGNALRNYAEKGTGANAQDMADLMLSISQGNLALYGGNAGLAASNFLQTYNPTSGLMFNQEVNGKKSYLYGQNAKFAASKDMQDTIANNKNAIVSLVSDQLVRAAGQSQMTVNGSDVNAKVAAMIQSAIDSGDPNAWKQINALITQAQAGFTDVNFNTGGTGLNAGLSGLTFTSMPTGNGKTDISNMTKDMKTTFDGFIKDLSNLFKTEYSTKPEWMTDKFINFVAKNHDTSTPRGSGIGDTTTSKLSQTMARHSAIDGQLTGKRTITSAYRTTGLGSINSDHLTGRALDLTGQNLGQYASMIKDGGGFAEFHGVGGDRHLHVVPGPGAVGDTSVPKVIASSSGRSGSQNNYYFTISGGSADAETIANRVMAKIENAQRQHKERS